MNGVCDIDVSTGQVEVYRTDTTSEILFNRYVLSEGPLDEICSEVCEEWDKKHPGKRLSVIPEIESNNSGKFYNIRFQIQIIPEEYLNPATTIPDDVARYATYYRTVRGIEKRSFIEHIRQWTKFNHNKNPLSAHSVLVVVKVLEKIAEKNGFGLLY